MRRSLGCLVLALPAAWASAGTDDVTIAHQGVQCVVAERFPRLEARIAPAEGVAVARIRFKPAGGLHWYSVRMKLEGEAFVGVLPQPKRGLASFTYYLEATGSALQTTRTGEHEPLVADGPAGCQGKLAAGLLNAAQVTLERVAGAPPIPLGFSPAGVLAGSSAVAGTSAGEAAAAGGGIGKAALLVGGLAAAGGAAAAVAGGGDNPGSPPGNPPSTSPSTGSPSSTNPPGGGFYAVYGVVYSTFGPNPANPTGPGVYGPPVVGAVVSISLDGSSTTTDGEGRFSLVTGTRYPVCITSTLTIAAPGQATYSASGYWGNNPSASSAWTFSLSPPMPGSGGSVPSPCS